MRNTYRTGRWERATWTALSVLPLVLLAQCNDAKSANKENFKAALTKFFGKSCEILPLGFSGFNPMLSGGSGPPANLSQAGLNPPQVSALEAAGMLVERRVLQPQRNLFGQSMGVIPAVVLTLTPQGKKIWSRSGLCDGRIEVVSVDRFTKPETVGGVKVTSVTFTARKHLDAWAAAPAVKAAFPANLEGPDTTQVTLPLQLNNDGWSVAVNRAINASN